MKIKIIRQYKKKNNIKRMTLLLFFDFLYYRLRYDIGIYDYFDNFLYNKKMDHSDYFDSLHSYIHKWKSCAKNYAGTKTRSWRFFHHIQFLFFKFLYPGLDAMDYFRYHFYSFKHAKRKAFITEGYLKRMNKHFNPINPNTKKCYDLLDNKIEFNSFFKEFINREWIPSNINYDEFVSFCKRHPIVFAKPACGGGGHGVRKIKFNNEQGIKDLFDEIHNKKYVVEEQIIQSNDINKMNRSSINTIRVYTVFYKNNVYITGATFRIGNGISEIDNYSLDNYAASINHETGLVDSTAVNQRALRIDKHPVTGTVIVGFKIPSWHLITRMVLDAHKKISQLRYIGWDVALDINNRPQLIEGNTFAGVELQQHPCLIGKKYVYKKFW